MDLEPVPENLCKYVNPAVRFRTVGELDKNDVQASFRQSLCNTSSSDCKSIYGMRMVLYVYCS